MRKLKQSISCVLVFLMVLSVFTILPNQFFNGLGVSAVDMPTEKSNEVKTDSAESGEEATYVYNDFIYSIINDNEVKIVGYFGGSSDVVVPNAITNSNSSLNKKITTIGNGAFKSAGITSVTLGNNIVHIEDYAFYKNNKLKKVDLSKCSNLITIGNYAFAENPELTEIDLSVATKLETLGNYAFSNNSKLQKVALPASTSLTKIGDYAFNKNIVLEEIDLSLLTNLEIIGDYAFYDNDKLKKVSLPTGTSLKTIGAYAFYSDYLLEEIDLSICKGLTTIGKAAFYSDDNLPDTLSLESIETIGISAFGDCDSIMNLEIGNKLKIIDMSAFAYTRNLTNVTIIGNGDAVIGEKAFYNGNTYRDVSVENLIIGNGVKTIGDSAFEGCYLWNVNIGDSVTTIGNKAITLFGKSELTIGKGITNMGTKAVYCFGERYFANIKILGTELTEFNDSLPMENVAIYCYKNSKTHKNLERRGYSNVLKFFETEISLTDIKVNNVSVSDFRAENKEYTASVDDITKVNITPVFESDDVKYEVTSENNVYTLNIFNSEDVIAYTYKITVKEKAPEVKYMVTGDVTLLLNNISSTKVGGSIALSAGTYKLKIAKDQKTFGYNKVVADYCNSLSLNEKFTSYITLNATGGTYTFQFDKYTNKLIIKHDKNMPNEYLIGDIDTILKPVGDRPLSIGTQQLPKGTYKFKLSIGGKEYGYNKVVNDATSGSLSMNSKYTAQVTLNATGGMYTFVLNTETNKLIIRHTPIDDECTTDVHISGTFNLVLNDKSATGEDLTVATGTTYLEDGCPTFKVYNYGVAYTSGAIFNNKGKRTLSSQYTTPITLNATGGNYKFVFDKETGVFEVSLVE